MDPKVREPPKLDDKKDVHYRVAQHVNLAKIPDQKKSVNISQDIDGNNLFKKVRFNGAISKVATCKSASNICLVCVSLASTTIVRNVAFVSEIYYMVRSYTNKYVGYAELDRDEAQDSRFGLGKACVAENAFVKDTKDL